MPGSQLNVHLYRDSFNTPWGFRLQGGKDLNQALTVQRVFSNSPAEGELQRGDVILAIGGEPTSSFSHKGAQDAISKSGGQINLVVNRPPPGCVNISPLSPPIHIQRPRAPSLQDTQPKAADVYREDLSPKSPNPRRPNNFQHTHQPSQHYGHNQHNNTSGYQNYNNMNQQRKHNQPIHVHIEPQRRVSQTTYYLHTPSPQPQQNQQGYFHSNDPYGTMPRRQRGYSQPPYQSPTTPTIPPPPWATQQASPKKVSKLSHLGGGEATIGTSFKSSTLPRYASQQNVAQHHAKRPQREEDETDAPDLFADRKPTGPPPKVCSRSNLGGGSINFSSGPVQSQTLPRRNIQRRLSQPPSMPSRSPYGIYGGATTPAQRFEPGTQNGVMLNRVQSSLDNITLSPRTPDGTHRTPFYQAPGQEKQFYTPTSLLLEQQKAEEQERKKKQHQHQQQLQQQQQQQQQRQYQPQPQPQPQPQYQPPPQQYQYQQPPPQQHQQNQYGGGQDEVDEGEEPVVPVWERRRQFQEAAPPSSKPGVRTPRSNPIPKVSRPAPGKTSYSDFGLSYRPQNQQSTASWQPVSGPQTPHAPPPQVVHYSSNPAGPGTPQSPIKTAPPPWKRADMNEDDTDGTPAWRNTLRTTGVKPWDVDLNYMPDGHPNQQQEPQRSVPYNPIPYQTMYSPKMVGGGGGAGDAQDGEGPKVVHLQYNSPMGLYSKENADETYMGQVSGLTGQQESPQPQANNAGGIGLPGGRDWSQSQVLQFIQSDKPKKGKGKPGPGTAPKPHAALRQSDQHQQHQHQQHQQQQQRQQHHHKPPPQQHHQHHDVGISDF